MGLRVQFHFLIALPSGKNAGPLDKSLGGLQSPSRQSGQETNLSSRRESNSDSPFAQLLPTDCIQTPVII